MYLNSSRSVLKAAEGDKALSKGEGKKLGVIIENTQTHYYMKKTYLVPEVDVRTILFERNFCESDPLNLKTEQQSGFFWDEE